MADLHGRIFLLAIQQIFFNRPHLAHELIRIAGSARELFEGDRAHFRPHFGNEEALWKRFASFSDWKEIERDLKKLELLGIEIVCWGDDTYPQLLSEIYDPPLILFVKGDGAGLLGAPAVAIVGSRKANGHGKELALRIAQYLSERGIVVVSGMAYGIDAAAHLGALQGEVGTIAVLGCGADIVYPPGHANLSRKISESGLVLSEFPLGTRPFAHHFPQRNRVISGLALATVVVEAAEKSGSLITARFALEQGREVAACPGEASHPSHRGANRLIRDGAHLVENGEDVLSIIASHLPPDIVSKRSGHFGHGVDKDSPLLGAVSTKYSRSVDELVATTGMEASDVLEALTHLIVAGVVEELPGRRFRKSRDS